jgi:hypothetical protein
MIAGQGRIEGDIKCRGGLEKENISGMGPQGELMPQGKTQARLGRGLCKTWLKRAGDRKRWRDRGGQGKQLEIE